MRINIKTIYISAALLVGMCMYSAYQEQQYMYHDVALANIEALTSDTEQLLYGCGRAAYQWDDSWLENTVQFHECMKGCPHQKGTSPLYTQCD